MCVVLFLVSLRKLLFCGWWNLYLWKPLYYFVAILHLLSQFLSIVLRCGGQLLNVTFSFIESGLARLRPDLSFLPEVIDVVWLGCMLYKVNSNSNHCLLSELLSASTRVRRNRAAAAAHPLEFEESRCRKSQFARSSLPAQVRLWNDLPYTEFDTGTLDGFKGGVNRWLLPWVMFPSVFRGAGACGVAKAIYKQLCLSHLGVCCWF